MASSRKKENSAFITAIVLVVVMVASVLYVNRDTPEFTSSKPTPSVIPVPAEEEMVIYVNSQYGYKIQYPSSSSALGTNPGVDPVPATGIERGLLLSSPDKVATVSIEVDDSGNLDRGTFKEWSKAIIQNFEEDGMAVNEDSSKFADQEAIFISSDILKAYLFLDPQNDNYFFVRSDFGNTNDTVISSLSAILSSFQLK